MLQKVDQCIEKPNVSAVDLTGSSRWRASAAEAFIGIETRLPHSFPFECLACIS